MVHGVYLPGHGANERAALIYQHESNAADRQIAKGLDALLRGERATSDGEDNGLMAS